MLTIGRTKRKYDIVLSQRTLLRSITIATQFGQPGPRRTLGLGSIMQSRSYDVRPSDDTTSNPFRLYLAHNALVTKNSYKSRQICDGLQRIWSRKQSWHWSLLLIVKPAAAAGHGRRRRLRMPTPTATTTTATTKPSQSLSWQNKIRDSTDRFVSSAAITT